MPCGIPEWLFPAIRAFRAWAFPAAATILRHPCIAPQPDAVNAKARTHRSVRIPGNPGGSNTNKWTCFFDVWI